MLFDRASEVIDDLEKRKDPWFLTVLNVGTHHPFDIVPKEFQGSDNAKVRSFEFLDFAFGRFIKQLRDRGDLDNTLIIVTSDESGGLVGDAPDYVEAIARNWGTLFFVHSDYKHSLVDRTVGQSDVSSLILTVLKSPQETTGTETSGESRPVFAYNNLGNTFFNISDGYFDVCATEPITCRRVATKAGKLGDARVLDAIGDSKLASSAIAYANQGGETYRVELVEMDTHTADRGGGSYIICCKYFDLEKGTTVSGEIAGRHLGSNPVKVTFDMVSVLDGKHVSHKLRELQLDPAQRFVFPIQFHAKEMTSGFEIRLRFDEATSVAIDKSTISFTFN